MNQRATDPEGAHLDHRAVVAAAVPELQQQILDSCPVVLEVLQRYRNAG